ncbi:Asp/Glu/hydantoin racemase [Pseudooceanicola antarcticus]|uniref:Hydantoin racemase n=1 Tax=Pseudooceanicola antarcticus TaxID=1247613 RepID=A0A285JCF0_9RHOB|nr:aspartate/glutamate racemase family protein [Pseudooceanicola antarcticus]PJE30937.1 hydantoin racemase [Pseudooceanicola antarcticus]SNY57960.1 Asp/Glu/hydantoin racemase [Pseudooceanicola antarcticus]
MSRILVLNPNSSGAITASISAQLDAQRSLTRHEILCGDLPDAPAGIESDADVALVAPMVRDRIIAAGADAGVIACFSDPGVDVTRSELSDRPVIGIAEAAYYAALQLGDRFGVISLGPSSIARHAARIADLGLLSRLAGDRDISMSVAEGNRPESFGKICDTARALRDLDGARVIILGCAGMGLHRAALQEALGLPVIDPVQAAVASAVAALDLEYYALEKTGA